MRPSVSRNGLYPRDSLPQLAPCTESYIGWQWFTSDRFKPTLHLSRVEIDRRAVLSGRYTAYPHDQWGPDTELFFMIGWDSWKFHTWYKPAYSF